MLSFQDLIGKKASILKDKITLWFLNKKVFIIIKLYYLRTKIKPIKNYKLDH